MSDIVEKWGKAVAGRGFGQVPNYLLLLNQFLDREHRLSPVELLVLIQLVGGWWNKGDLPFPAMATLALRCGVSSRQVQRAIGKLEELGLIKRVKRRTRGIIASNAYDMSPLVEFLGDVAKEFPNEFPRNVDKEIVRKLSGKLVGEEVEAKDASAEAAKVASIAQPLAGQPKKKRLVMPRKREA